MSTDPKRVVIYARVSSDRQDVDLSISAQLRALREYAARNNLTIVREFVDEAESGRTSARPAFREMISLRLPRERIPSSNRMTGWTDIPHYKSQKEKVE